MLRPGPGSFLAESSFDLFCPQAVGPAFFPWNQEGALAPNVCCNEVSPRKWKVFFSGLPEPASPARPACPRQSGR